MENIEERKTEEVGRWEPPFFYRYSLGRLSCPKAQYYCIAGANQNIGPAANYGTDMHKVMENFLLGKSLGKAIHPDLRDELRLKYFRPENLERTFEVVDYDNQFAWKGTLDAISEDGWIWDWKFPQSDWDGFKIAKQMEDQGWLYAWGAQEGLSRIGEGPDIVGVKIVVSVSGFKPRIHSFPVDLDVVDGCMRRHRAKYRSLCNMYRNNLFPAQSSSWTCRFCNYRDICPERK